MTTTNKKASASPAYTYTLHPDPNAESPREWDTLSTMLFSHRRYKLGDEPPEWWQQLDRQGYTWHVSWDHSAGEYTEREISCASWEERENLLRAFLKDDGEEVGVLSYVSMHDHGGRVLKLGSYSGWDSGVIGFIYATKRTLRTFYGVTHITERVRQDALDAFEHELEAYNSWIEGDVWVYDIFKNGVLEHSLSGIFGYAYAQEQAEEEIRDLGRRDAEQGV